MLQYYMPNISHLSPYPSSVGVFQDYQTAPYLNLQKQDGNDRVDYSLDVCDADEDFSMRSL